MKILPRGVISFGYLDREQLDPEVPLDNLYSEDVALQIAREDRHRMTSSFVANSPCCKS